MESQTHVTMPRNIPYLALHQFARENGCTTRYGNNGQIIMEPRQTKTASTPTKPSAAMQSLPLLPQE